MSLPEENCGLEEQLRRIVDDFRQALRDGCAPGIEDVIAQYPELAELLRSQLMAAAADAPRNQELTGSSAGTPSDETMDWTPGDSADGNTGSPAVNLIETASTGNTSTPADIGIDSTIGEYRLLRKLGTGGMGVVYEAEHVGSGRRLALKLLSPHLPRTRETIDRFLNEASLAAALSHRRTTFVYEAGEADGQFFIAMELMPGRTLKDTVKSQGRLPVNQAVDCVLDVLEGLEAAHRSGVVHRDVKPSNCFLDAQGRVKVGDFGLSKSLVSESDLTRTGTFLGTPQFAAPEQIRQGTVDSRTDIFSVGATLYYLLAGEGPFTGDPAAVIAQIVADDAPPVESRNPDVPKSLSKILGRAMQKDPKRRFRDVGEFRRALLPYSTQGTSIADMGRRVAAFFIDSFLLSIITVALVFIYAVARDVTPPPRNDITYALASILTWIPYFVICEGLFACSIGKYCLGLRVLDVYGERAGLWRAAIRALVLPGMTWLPVNFAQSYLFSSNVTSTNVNFNMWNVVVVPVSFQLAHIGLCLLVCSTMRKRNGFRGFHEFVSGTNVVRPFADEAATITLSIPRLAPVHDEQTPKTIGPFAIRGRLGLCGQIEVFAAHDERLDRPVWVWLTTNGAELSSERMRLVRPSRPHWLQHGEEKARQWQAVEAIDGAPLTEITRYATLPWAVGREVLLELAEELQASLADRTLPDQLTLDQVWVNERGRVKLMDFPLRKITAESTRIAETAGKTKGSDRLTDTPQHDSDGRVVRLLRETADICCRDEETPGEALDMMLQLRRCVSEKSAVQLVRDRLGKLVMQPYRFRWDERLGVLAVAAGLESVLYGAIPLLIAIFLGSLSGLPLFSRIILAAMSGLLPPAAVGYWMRGGFAFWLTKTGVRNLRREAASHWRCAWRNVIAWSALALTQGVLGAVLVSSSRFIGSTAVSPSRQMSATWSLLGLYVAILCCVQVVGFLFAILQPRRGLQDLIAGTYLVRR